MTEEQKEMVVGVLNRIVQLATDHTTLDGKEMDNEECFSEILDLAKDMAWFTGQFWNMPEAWQSNP